MSKHRITNWSLQKGDTVWYWDKRYLEWKRGKLIAVRYRSVTVKGKGGKLFCFWVDEAVYDAAKAKPDYTPGQEFYYRMKTPHVLSLRMFNVLPRGITELAIKRRH